MDEYYLSKEEWDTVVELGVGDHKDDKVLKGISTATKTAFTRKSVEMRNAYLDFTDIPLTDTILWTILLRSINRPILERHLRSLQGRQCPIWRKLSM